MGRGGSVVVVGAGFAGLAAADALAAAGIEVAVLEARPRAGGRVHSRTLDGGAVVELGAEFVLPGYETLTETASRLGLPLYEKGALYGDHEPRGGPAVTRSELLDAPASLEIDFEPALPQWKRDALASVRYGQAAKLFLPLAAPAEPSATLSVPDRFWTWTRRSPEGTPLPVTGSFAGTAAALERLEVDRGPEAWADAVRQLRPDLALAAAEPLPWTWHDDPWARGAYSVRSLSSPLDDEALARPVRPLAFAGEHTAGAWHGLMEGALRSGRRAAEDVLCWS